MTDNPGNAFAGLPTSDEMLRDAPAVQAYIAERVNSPLILLIELARRVMALRVMALAYERGDTELIELIDDCLGADEGPS